MSAAENALTARLEGSTAVTSIASTRIYPNTLPQDPKLPAVVHERISTVRESFMTADDGQVTSRHQVTCWAADPQTALDLANGVRAATQRWAGTSTGVVVQEVFIENEFAFYDDDTGDFAQSLDLIVHHEE